MQYELFEYKSQGKGTPQAKAEKIFSRTSMTEVRNRNGNERGQEDLSNLGEAIQTAGDSKHRSDQTEMITLLNIGKVF